MDAMDILESRIREAISREMKLAEEHEKLQEELGKLRESINKLERHKQETNTKLDRVIEKVELYLRRSEA